MSRYNEAELLLNIQQLIDKNACSIDGFFTDSRSAAGEILRYLKSEEIIVKNEVAVEITFDEKSWAA